MADDARYGGKAQREDDAHTSGDPGQVVLGVRKDTASTLASTDGDYTPPQMDSTGRVRVVTTGGAGGGSSAIDDSVFTPGVDSGTVIMGFADEESPDSVGEGDAGAVRITLDRKLHTVAGGEVAHDGVDGGGPIKVGMKAVAHSANPTAVAAADRTDWYANRHGIPFVMGGHPNIIVKNLQISDGDGAQTDAAIITVATSNKIVVTWYKVVANNANTGDVQCRIGFGTANTPAVDAAGVIMSHEGIAAGSGVVVGNGGGIIGVGGDNEDLRLTCEDPAGGHLDIVVGYFIIPS